MRQTGTDMREYIAFRIGEQEFCADVMSVREIRGWTPATPLPHSPRHVCGVINLRGAVLPIVDLSLRLGMQATVPTARHVIIVMQLGHQLTGILVDAVSDILMLDQAQIQPTPEVSGEPERQFSKGIIPIDSRMVCLVALDALFEHPESKAA